MKKGGKRALVEWEREGKMDIHREREGRGERKS